MTERKPIIDDNLHWYKDAVIYELHVKAFRDKNCDGIGDFEGLLEKLDYLQNLGITAIWLLPFYPSPLRDDGYDIADYYSVNPAYGNIKQFKKLLHEAHNRNLKVITELVINHTSDQHPWFQKARRAPKGSPERNYYVWTDNPEQYKDARIIFQDFESSNWTWDPIAQQYYWHRFFHHQPDLNFDNPAVQDEVFKMIDYWCGMGVDGFRLDAVPYLFERDDTNCENLPETHDFLKRLRKHVDEKFPGTLLLAEANMWPEDAAYYFGNGDECHMNYHFPVMPRMFMALQMEDRYPIVDIFDQTPAIPDTCQWAIFLRNHDELTLEMVTDEERDYMYKVYVKDPKARINLGIRHRLAPLMDNNRAKIELLNYLLFSLPGTPVIYYGDEIGMGDNFYLGDRDGVRTPMQWTVDRNAGFSEANPQRLYLPVILDPLYHYESVNVEIENRNTSSLLWFMKRLINTRKKHKAFGRGDMKFVNTENPKVLAFTRAYEDEIMLVVVNLSRYSQPAELDLSEYKGYKLVEVFSNNNFPSVKGETPYFFTLSQYECQWFSLKDVSHPEHRQSLPIIEMKKWSDVMTGRVKETLENSILPDYLMKMRWFGGKARGIQGLRIIGQSVINIDSNNVVMLLIEVSYTSELPEIYQLPLTFAIDTQAATIKENYPKAIVCNAKVGNETGVLYDALFSEALQQEIVKLMGGNAKATATDNDEIIFTGNRHLKAYLKGKEKIKSRILAAEQSNTSIVYDSAYFLKLYRKVDRSINPDVEITRFLTEKAKFKHIPAYVGTIEWDSNNGSMVLGMMQEMVDNNTDGWNFMLDRLSSFNEKILSDPRLQMSNDAKKTSVKPITYDNLSTEIKELLETPVTERVNLLGERTGEMHLALASSNDDAAFKPEPFSLHYQRSLFSSFQSLVRKTYQTLVKTLNKLPDDVRQEAEEVLQMKDEILLRFRAIYKKKFDVLKIRVHGDYHLGQTLFTGKDILIIDFEGEPAKTYSERRLKRAALRDVAGMIRSFHYAAYGSLFLNNSLHKEDIKKLVPYVEQWQHYMSGLYLQSYLHTVKDSMLVPKEKEDMQIMLQTYILEKAIYELNYELNNRPDWVIIPLRGIKAIMDQKYID
ncbi:MAG: maltose alpha-D-glucosyltransferase [Bacteroidetes bacterium]|nr:maltose alpha-D-glucosyltransferase [Bacteroidota bacterium]